MRREIWDKNRETLRRKLREIRINAGLTQTDVAERLGTRQTFISKYEMGERNLDFIEVIMVCEACNFPPEELIRNLKIKL